MPDGLVIALVGFVAAIVGGLIQVWATRRFDVSRFERQNRHDAYLSYLNGISRLSFAKDDNDEILAALAQIAEARGRVALGDQNPWSEKWFKCSHTVMRCTLRKPERTFRP